MRIFIFLFSYLVAVNAFCQDGSYQISGTISAEGEQLIGATVLIHELRKGVVSNGAGEYIISGLKPGSYHMHVTFVGYESYYHEFRIEDRNIKVDIEMRPSSIELREVTVEANPFKSGAVEQSQTIKVVDRDFLDKNIGNSFVNSIEKIPGVNAINTGVGISKPVIRGMSFNRIMVNDHGIKQEGQQWGADHGLEIDMFDVDRVEIIKGPASLMYGSDGMGGVININSVSFPKEDTYEGGIKGIYKTNNNLRGTSAFFQGNKDGVVFKGRFSMQDFDNYRVPAQSFRYAGYILGLPEGILRNTAGKERNFSFMAGLNKNWGFSTVSVSRFKQKVGLFPGAVGRPTSYTLSRYDRQASIDLPRQNNEHWKVISNTNILIRQNWLEVDLGYQYNIRREESLPHTQNTGMTDAGNLALGLDLQTLTANVRYHTRINGAWKGIHGLQLQYMQNDYQGFEFLLPAFQSMMSGIFSFYEYKPDPDLTVSSGVRFDWGMHDIQKHEQPIYRFSTELGAYAPTGEVDVRNNNINRHFSNISGQLGASWIATDFINLKLNLGSSFRMPTAIELASNGVHHGTFRHELGDPDLSSERGFQLDFNATYSSKKFYLAFTPYFSLYDNYIYLAPTGQFSRLPSGSQLTWEFRQSSARFYGGEFETEYHFTKAFHMGVNAEYVRSYNLDFRLPLPLTPPPSLMADVEYDYDLKEVKWLESIFLNYYVKTFAAQNRVDRNELRTPGYTIMGASTGFNVMLGKQAVNIMLSVENLTNQQYFNHLSRYRLLNLPEQGRNFIITLELPIQGNFR